jgi:hypothetical protein
MQPEIVTAPVGCIDMSRQARPRLLSSKKSPASVLLKATVTGPSKPAHEQ